MVRCIGINGICTTRGIREYWKNNGICTTRGLREHSLEYELNPFSGLGGDVLTSFFLIKIRQTN